MARTLKGQRVVVVGASAGMGREFARGAILEGAQVLLTARREDRLRELAAEAGGGIPFALDITDPASCAALAEKVKSEFASVDLVLVSAGYSPLRSLEEATPEDWRRVLEINVIGIHQLIRTLLPVASPRGIFAVMSSESTLQPRHALGVYTASKAALELSMRVWRQEQPTQRFTTLIVGGTFPTDFGADFEVERLIPAMNDWARHGAVQEDLMTPHEVADVLLGSLASIVDVPGVSLDQIVIRSPSAVVGSSQHLEADAADNIASINAAQ
ncbi:MAG: short-chain alcohol dehydrogenase [Mycobacterium sp.]|nr:short-chain alcohol dehydrogenase [Mycobacterium sp.]